MKTDKHIEMTNNLVELGFTGELMSNVEPVMSIIAPEYRISVLSKSDGNTLLLRRNQEDLGFEITGSLLSELNTYLAVIS